MSAFESIYFGIPMVDINAQPNIFSRELYKKWLNPPYDFSLDLYFLYMAKINRIKVVRFFVYFPERIYGESK